MPDEELLEPIGVQEIFVDYFTRHVSIDGVMRCAGVRRMNGETVVVIRLAWPVVTTEHSIEQARVALAVPDPPVREPPKRGVH